MKKISDEDDFTAINEINRHFNFKIDKEVFDRLFSDSESDIIQTTEFNDNDLRTATVLEMMDAFVIEPYVTDYREKTALKTLKRRIYQMRVSKNRKGREELINGLYKMDAEQLKKEVMGNRI